MFGVGPACSSLCAFVQADNASHSHVSVKGREGVDPKYLHLAVRPLLIAYDLISPPGPNGEGLPSRRAFPDWKLRLWYQWFWATRAAWEMEGEDGQMNISGGVCRELELVLHPAFCPR